MGISGRLRWPTLAVGVGAIGAVVALSGCAVGGESCTLSGVASFSPGLKTQQAAVSYTFTGKVGLCQSAAGDPTIKSGTVSASGSGPKVGCTGGNTSGTATISWN